MVTVELGTIYKSSLYLFTSISMIQCAKKYSYRRSHPEVFLGKGVLKIRSIFIGEHPRGNGVSIRLKSCNFIEITLCDSVRV